MNIGELFQAVRDAFAGNGGTTSVVFGEREPTRQDNQGPAGASRIVVVPCEGDAIGDVQPGQEGNIGALQAKAVIYVWASDPDAPEDEAAQYVATRVLFGALYSFLWRASAGTIQFGRVTRVKMLERLLGAEWRFAITLRDDLEFDPYTLTTEELIPAPRFVFRLPA
jgi:hypothetical protein